MFDEINRAIGVSDVFSLGECMVFMVSSRTVVVINMLGLISLESDEIVLKADKYRKLKISGANLKTQMLNRNEITIHGNISSVCFQGGD